MVKRWISRLAAVAFFSTAALIGLAQTSFVKERIAHFLENWIAEETGYRLEIGQISLIFPNSLKGQQLRFWDRDNKLVATFDTANFSISLHALLYRVGRITDLQLQGTLGEQPIIFEGEAVFAKERSLGIGTLNHQLMVAAAIKDKDVHFYLKAKEMPLQIRGKAAIRSESGLRIKISHAIAGPLFLNGRLSLLPDGQIKDSSFTLKSHPLSSPFSGTIHGNATVFGSLFKPNFSLLLESEALQIWQTQLEKVRAEVHANGHLHALLGSLSLRFNKEGDPYHFQGSLRGKHQSLNFFSTVDLQKLLLLFDIDRPETAGRVDAELLASSKGVEYAISLHDGYFEESEIGLSLQKLEASLSGNLTHLHLLSLQGIGNGGGELTGKGELVLDPRQAFPYIGDFELKQFSLPDREEFAALWNGKIRLSGDWEKADISGMLHTEKALFSTDTNNGEEVEAIVFRYINQSPDRPPPTPATVTDVEFPVHLNLLLQAEEGVRIFGSEMESEWQGEIELKGTTSSPQLSGGLKLKSGALEAGGRTFIMRRGTLSFNGDPDRASLFLASEVEIDRLTIELIVKGPVTNPALILRSTPALSQQEILSWLLFNRPIEDIAPIEREQLSFTFADLKSASHSPDLLTQIKKRAGLDLLAITQSKEGDLGKTSVQIGKYISQGTLVTISHNVNRLEDASTRCFGIETRLSKELKLRAQIDDDSNGQLNLVWKKDY